jgi:hypothetical protein
MGAHHEELALFKQDSSIYGTTGYRRQEVKGFGRIKLESMA